MADTAETLVEIAQRRALEQPEERAYTFLEFRPERTEQHVTYGELHRQAQRIARLLAAGAKPGDRALLLYENGFDFIAAFLGCLYARVIAVPAPLAKRGRGAARVQGILADSGASVVLCARSGLSAAKALASAGLNLTWLLTDADEGAASAEQGAGLDELGADQVRGVAQREEIAFLQYSSGSTGAPRGVMITHRNLLNQSRLLYSTIGGDRESCLVSWLPVFHDMGLVAGVLQPLFGGFRGVLMTPEAFVESPQRWLEAISDFRGTFSAAPNFAYELCVRRIPEEVRQRLALSSWRVAAVAAEPVRAATLDAFAASFASCGFAREALQPGYGLAENTLVASLGTAGRGPSVGSFDSASMAGNRVVPYIGGAAAGSPGTRRLVGSGLPAPDQQLIIARPDDKEAPGDEVGEVWVAGPSVGAGYWGKPEQTRETFGAMLVDGRGPYLRTGDLGFLHNGELFLCGRLKDLIILSGRNHHAPDIEATVESCNPALLPASGAAFSIEAETDQPERLVVVHELDRRFKPSESEREALIVAIQQAIVRDHEIQAHEVILVKHGALPKTSSGKIQRNQCRKAYREGTLRVHGARKQPGVSSGEQSSGPDPNARKGERQGEIERWLAEEVSRQSGRAAAELNADTAFADLRLTPEGALSLVRSIELYASRMLPGDILNDFPTIGVLAAQLDNSVANAQASAASSHFATSSAASAVTEPIAIVGAGCRYPGASGLRELWALLCESRESVTEVPFERWDVDEFFDSNVMAPGKMSTRRGGFLEGIEQMDRNFFELSVRETVRMDPQHRLMLETAWEALEDAGLLPAKLSGTPVGVFVGISGSDYAQRQFADPALADAYAGQGSALTVAASRISHYFNFLGPAIAVDTACSSSLTAIHLACSSIHSGECSIALAGGVNILLSPTSTMCLSKAGMMAPDGRCKAFDARANGYVRSEGAGIVVLKRLSQAITDGDPIHAVIRGTASNQDGRSSGLMAPNGEAQEAVILAACRNAGISPGDLDYVEAHGTGTPVGDPIELKALGKVLSEGRVEGRICAVGSIKTNIGHTESAAGVAGMIKASLILKHRLVPPSLHFEQPNPMIPFASIPVRVATELGELPKRDRPSLAGVNGFGVGGTNVHIVLEEAPTPVLAEQQPPPRPYLLPLSARSAWSLSGSAMALAKQLRESAASAASTGSAFTGSKLPPLEDLCFTAAARRSHLEHRLAVTGRNAVELAEALEQYADTGAHGSAAAHVLPSRSAGTPKLSFIFSGQGSQWVGMGRSLLLREPVFRHVIETCDTQLLALTGWSLLDLLTNDEGSERLDETQFVQPALFAMQIGVAALLRSWGIVPDSVAGHSIGEVAAAHVSGALDLASALTLVAHRGRIMQAATGLGRMVNVEMTQRELEPMLNGWSDRISVAAVNSPQSVVVSGEPEAMSELLEQLERRSVHHVPLPVNYAFHSPQMDPFQQELQAAVPELHAHAASIPMFSTVTAARCAGEELHTAYWSANLRLPVLLAPTIEAMAAEGTEVFLEIGPHAVLSGSIARTLKAAKRNAAVVSSMRRAQDEQASLMLAVGTLHTLGRPIDWRQLYPSGKVTRALPTYRWDRQRYWLDVAKPAQRLRDAHPLLGLRMPVAQPTWQSKLDPQTHPFLGDMQRNRRPLVPPSTFVEVALAAASELYAPAGFQLTGITHLQPFELHSAAQSFAVQATASPLAHQDSKDGASTITIFASTESGDAGSSWQPRLQARASAYSDAGSSSAPLELPALEELCPLAIQSGELYHALDASGLHHGAALRCEETLRQGAGHALLRLRVDRAEAARFLLHPCVLEAATLAARLAHGVAGLALDPTEIQRIRLLRTGVEATVVYARLRESAEAGETLPRCDVFLAEGGGSVLATLEGVRLEPRALEVDLAIPSRPDDWLYEVQWQPTAPIEPAKGAASGKTWLLFADDAGAGAQLHELFTAGGASCLLVKHGREYSKPAKNSFLIDPAKPEHLRQLFAEAFPPGHGGCAGIVHLWGLDATASTDTSAASLLSDQALLCESLLALVQTVSSAGFARPPRLLIATSGVHQVTFSREPHFADEPAALSQSMVWGLRKVIAIEHAELRAKAIDLSGSLLEVELAALHRECMADDPEDQVALRGSERYVARLQRPAPATAEHVGGDLVGNHPGRRGFAGAQEIEVRVLAARCPSDACVGVVVEAGSESGSWQLGDEVVVLAEDCRAPYLTVDASRVAAKPPALSAAEAAACVRPLLTARFALEDVARLRRDEALLIHGACTEVGLAALQIARRVGARVLVSAANDEERARLAALGCEPILDEDSLASPSQVLAKTERKGVDVLLNCRAGAAIPETIQSLAAFGRYLDSTRPQAAMIAALGDYKLRGSISLHAIDLALLLEEAPERASGLLTETLTLLNDGELRPAPMRVYEVSELALAPASGSAFSPPLEAGESAVLLLPSPAGAEDPGAHAVAYRPDATYLISGGLGGLGLGLAERMVDRGVRHLILLGRSMPTPAARLTLERLERSGAQVMVASVDVSDASRLEAILEQARGTMPPLRGVMHAAGMLANELLASMTAEGFRAVLPSKVVGAWHLHTLTREMPLDFFVMFSSLASMLGSPGQGNYAAANAFLDGLAVHRRQIGLPALSVCWGPWAAIGMAAGEHAMQRMSAGGLGMLPPEQAFDLQEQMLREQTAPVIGAIAIDWRRWAEMHPGGTEWPFVSGLMPAGVAGGRRRGGRVSFAQLQQLDTDGRVGCLAEAIRDVVCESLRLDPAGVRQDVSLSALGLDSIVALELKSRLEAAIDVVVQTVSLLQGPTIQALAEQFLSQLAADSQPAADEPTGEPAATGADTADKAGARDLASLDAEQLLDELPQLSDEEVDTLLLTMTQEATQEAAEEAATEGATQ